MTNYVEQDVCWRGVHEGITLNGVMPGCFRRNLGKMVCIQSTACFAAKLFAQHRGRGLRDLDILDPGAANAHGADDFVFGEHRKPALDRHK